MAHKYTSRGEDKGYDVFVDVAIILRQKHDDIYFHVAGGFDQHVIDVSSLGDRIKFYGLLSPNQIDGFFQGHGYYPVTQYKW
jgi:glycosyltransferase involved in cell wall biosynthesis